MSASIIGVVALLLFGLTGAAQAQCIITSPGGSLEQDDIFCSSTARIETTLPTVVEERIDTYSTQLIGRLSGNSTRFYDQTFSVPFGDAAFSAGVLSAQQILQGQSSDPLAFTGPTLIQSATARVGSASSTRQVGEPVQTAVTLITLGPAVVQVGDFGTCTRFDTSLDPPVEGCSLGGVPFVAGDDSTVFNGFAITTFTYERVTTDTWLTTAVYEIVGQRQPGTSVPVPATLALLGLGLLGMRLGSGTRRRTRSA